MTELAPEELLRVGALLASAGEELAGPLEASLVVGGRSNLTYRLSDGRRSWALRRPPRAAVIESAHDMAREYRVVAALRGTAVPVARPVVLDEGGALGVPCAIVEFVEGRTVRSRDALVGWSPADHARCAAGLVDTLAALHAIDPASVGLGEHGRPGGYAARQLRRWHRQWEQIGGTDPRADRLHARLTALPARAAADRHRAR
ncbi:phosphotransferase family protein [Nocardioides sp. TF02-7]|uniref:phosphotransferase family protein n=1 Tax=Nocardioides sp. TF02-7 TaxID=2917724 RepID=UPI001F070FE4|nr:phosphotransferase family protein [Nocardioides sp. TF02-7]UMG92728.1 phosphotransferase family protein [Nocardioides sp. TF02-7]